MKLAEYQGVELTQGIQRRTQVTIASNAKAFKLLINDLYPDKIKAPIRELATNALDAHIEAGNLDTPFVVTLPTADNLYFGIRDYGTGMSQEKIESLYSILCESDKDQSNDVTGCLGIGSKSPFAYINSFYVTSYYEGRKYMNVVTAVGGMPEIQFFGDTETDEPNGMDIGFTVQEKDVLEFHDKARRIFKYFKNKPKIEGPEIVFEEQIYAIKTDKWGVTGGQSMAVMGGIAYPIDSSFFHEETDVHPNAPSQYQSRANYKKLLSLGLELNFPLGDLEMMPNREGLQYTDFTVNAIKALLNEVKAEIVGQVSEKFSSCKNLWEARRTYRAIISEFGQMRDMVKAAGAVYNGIELSGTVELTDKLGVRLPELQGVEIKNFTAHLSKHVWRCSVNDKVVDIKVPIEENEVVFLEKDIVIGAIVGARNMAIATQKSGATVVLVSFQDDAAKKAFLDVVGIDESYIVKASSLPKTVRTKTGVIKEKVFKLKRNMYGYRYASTFWESADIDIDDGGIYVEINRYQTKIEGQGLQPARDLNQLLDKFTNMGITVPTIIGIKSCVVKKFAEYEDADWLEVKTALLGLLAKHVKDNNLAQVASDVRTYKQFNKKEKYTELTRRGTIQVKENSDFDLFLQKVKSLHTIYLNESGKLGELLDAARVLGYNFVAADPADLNVEANVLEAKYPVLKLVDNYPSKEETDIVLTYINKENE